MPSDTCVVQDAGRPERRPVTEADLPFVTALYAEGCKRYPIACVRDEAVWHYELKGRDPLLTQAMLIIQRPDGSYANSGPLAGTRRFGDPDRKLLCGPTPWGELVAVNMDTGDIAWRKTLGVSDALPAGPASTLEQLKKDAPKDEKK